MIDERRAAMVRAKRDGTVDAWVAEAMANGDAVRTWPHSGRVEAQPAGSAALGALCGMKPCHVRSVQRRIRDQLGWQAQ